jgi:hypothetical protein
MNAIDSSRHLESRSTDASAADRPASGALATWNRLFRGNYPAWWIRERGRLGSHEWPVLIRLDDVLVLCHDGQRESVEVDDGHYHELKAVSHLVPGLALHLLHAQERALPGIDANELSELERLLEQTRGDSFDDALHTACETFLDAYRSSGCVSAAAIEKLATAYRNALRPLLARAGEHALRSLDKAVRGFESAVGDPHAWSALSCVVCSDHQPRYGELSKQYFARYLVSRNIGGRQWPHRLIYAEGRHDVDEALDLVAQRAIDARIGRLLLDGPSDLDRDVLAHAAATTLDEMFMTRVAAA